LIIELIVIATAKSQHTQSILLTAIVRTRSMIGTASDVLRKQWTKMLNEGSGTRLVVPRRHEQLQKKQRGFKRRRKYRDRSVASNVAPPNWRN
jgi:hypothetical protein